MVGRGRERGKEGKRGRERCRGKEGKRERSREGR